MAARFRGGCACGSVTYTAHSDPIIMLNCHCRDCQRATGSAYAPFVVVPKGAVHIEGEVTFYGQKGDNGYLTERGFCSGCGSPIVVKLARLPDILGIMAASLDDPTMYAPSTDIFAGSAQPWDHMAPDTRKFAQELVREGG